MKVNSFTNFNLLPLLNSVIGMALAPWDVLGGGKIRTDAEEQRRRESGEKGDIPPLFNFDGSVP